MNIFIDGAWPYANSSLHIGHIASLFPGDVLARYFNIPFQAYIATGLMKLGK